MLNENLKILRRRRGLSQEELASRLHVVRQTVSKWETGLSVPDADLLLLLAEELDTTTAELLGESPASEDPAVPEISDLARCLEALNAQMAHKNSLHKKRMRVVWTVILIVSVLALLHAFLPEIYAHWAMHRLQGDAAVIGGADAPTGISVSVLSLSGWRALAGASGTAAAVFGLYRLRHR